MEWQPTHLITLSSGEEIRVMTSDGLPCSPAYTIEEWIEGSTADYEVKEESWLFQGEPFSGTVRRLEETTQAHLESNEETEVWVIRVSEYRGWEGSPRDALFPNGQVFISEKDARSEKARLDGTVWVESSGDYCQAPEFYIEQSRSGSLFPWEEVDLKKLRR